MDTDNLRESQNQTAAVNLTPAHKILLLEMAGLEVDCKIGKDRHFIAADRKNFYRISLGIFSVIGSAVISSGIVEKILVLVGSYYPGSASWDALSKVIPHVIPLIVGISTAVLGFLGLEKQTSQHRYVGNSYIQISRRLRSLINSAGTVGIDEVKKEYEELLSKYLEINREGESCPTNDRDSRRAIAMNLKAKNLIKSKIAAHDRIQLDLNDSPSPLIFSKFLRRSLYLKLLSFLVRSKFIRPSAYRSLSKSII